MCMRGPQQDRDVWLVLHNSNSNWRLKFLYVTKPDMGQTNDLGGWPA